MVFQDGVVAQVADVEVGSSVWVDVSIYARGASEQVRKTHETGNDEVDGDDLGEGCRA
jgi:hypothetical protein